MIRHGDIAIQDLLLRSMAVITDYTSAAIDFSFLDRPVFYYQFDRTRFLGKRPSHFDLDDELPGEIVATRAELMRALAGAAERDFAIHPDASARRPPSSPTATPTPGSASCRGDPRAAPADSTRRSCATRSRRRRRLWRRVKRRPAVRRRSRTGCEGRCAPASTAVARRLPRSGLVAFESNLGADYGDSPGAIHRALRERGLPVPHRLGVHDRRRRVPRAACAWSGSACATCGRWVAPACG